MIAAHELRIGNWVNYSFFFKKEQIYRACKILAIKLDGVALDDIHGVLSVGFNDSLSPIPLTPEMLLACGFSESKYKEELKIDLPEYAIQLKPVKKNWEVWGCSKRGVYLQFLTQTKSLHHLQNITYSLTHTELKYQP